MKNVEEFETPDNTSRAINLVKELTSPSYLDTFITRYDASKLTKIKEFVLNNNKVTTKQYKEILFFCKVYGLSRNFK